MNGPDDIPVEVWRCSGECTRPGFFLTDLKTKTMPNEWRKNVLLQIFQEQGF